MSEELVVRSLAWLGNGTARAAELGVSPDRVINTRPAAEMRR